jgi:uncharacterized protein (DUF934 family)
MLIRLENDHFHTVEDRFTAVGDDDALTGDSAVMLSLARFEADGPALLAVGRDVGVRVGPADRIEALADDLPRLALVALEFPKYRDGRAYSSAVLLRERFGFGGELRAVGDVLIDQAWNMVRCGFDAFETTVGPNAWAAAARRYRHVYQASADNRVPAFAERARDVRDPAARAG